MCHKETGTHEDKYHGYHDCFFGRHILRRHEWISTDKPHSMTLDAGKYTLREEKALDGYVTAEEVTFEVVLVRDSDDIEVMKVVVLCMMR